MSVYTNAAGETFQPGQIVLAPYKNTPLWPSIVRGVGKPKKPIITYVFLPHYQGNYTFKAPAHRIQLFKPEMEASANGGEELKAAYETAREYHSYSLDQTLDLIKNPPARPEPVKPPIQESKSTLGKRKASAKKHQYREHDDHEFGHNGDRATGADFFENEDRDVVDELEALLEDEDEDAPRTKRIRRLEANEIIFAEAVPTKFKSKDEIVLIRNPNGVGLWPALPLMISEEKCFANFELFPRVSTAKRTRNGQPPQPKIIRTIDTEIFGFEERRLKTMIEFSHGRDEKLEQALIDVRKYLQDSLRFDEKTQERWTYKDGDLEFIQLRTSNNEASTLAFDELHLTTSNGDRLSPIKDHEHKMNTLSSRQLEERRLLEEAFAVARQIPNVKPMWLFSNSIEKPNYELSYRDMISEPVQHYFEEIWKGLRPCPLHDIFYRRMTSTSLAPYYPSSYRIDGCTGGLISNESAEKIIQEYLMWIDLSTKLPKIPSAIKKLRYAIEKRNWIRERAEGFLLDSHDHAYATGKLLIVPRLSIYVFNPFISRERRPPTCPNIIVASIEFIEHGCTELGTIDKYTTERGYHIDKLYKRVKLYDTNT